MHPLQLPTHALHDSPASALMLSRRGWILGMGAALVAGASDRAFAEADGYPSKAVRVIIPYPPGGPTDIVGRVLCAQLSEAFGQSFVAENRAGASGIIGADLVARASPDGYTLLVNVSAHVINPSLYDKLPHDPLKDFAPITNLARTPMQLVVAADLPAKSVKELIDYVRARPGKCSFASSSNGAPSHLAGELFRKTEGLDVAYVPYKGSAPALTDILGGQVTYMFDSMPSSAALVKSGRLRALAVTSEQRVPSLPGVPTLRESGVDFAMNSWYGLWAPAGTPDTIVQQLYAAVARTFATPQVKARLADVHSQPVADTPSHFAAYCRSEAERYRQIVRSAGIVLG